MAREVQVTTSLRILSGKVDYRGQPTTFAADLATTKGPTPGLVVATVHGTDVNLSLLTTPGFCRIQNLDATNYVEVGNWDPEYDRFYPLMEIGPGETYVIKLSRWIGWEFGSGASTGTGTLGAETNTLRVRAARQTCNVLVEAFEKSTAE